MLHTYLKPQWPHALLLTVLLFCHIGLQLIVPQIMRFFIDTALTGGELRALINAGNEISGSAFLSDGRTAAQILDAAERLVFDIAEKGSRGRKGFKALKDILPEAVDRIDAIISSR